MLDFSALVLRPNMTTFGRPLQIEPLMSQPGALPYDVWKGIFTSRPENFLLADGTIVSDNRTWFGARVVDLPATLPAINDRLTVPPSTASGYPGLPGYSDGVTFIISDVRLDGQGGIELQCRKIVE